MSATSPLGALGGLMIALGTVLLLQRWFGAPPPVRRFSTLDGLRGYAAFLVYLQHSAAWYVFARTGVWAAPATRLYVHFGRSSVAIFFMITGFLFWSKLVDRPTRPLDWRRLYVSRVLRLAPLFIVFVAGLWALALMTSGPRLRVSAARAALQTVQWLTFTTAGMPNLNLAPTSIIGGAAWSLPYEWWFYLALPLGAVLMGLRLGRPWLAVGIAAAFLVRRPAICRAAGRPAASIIAIAALVAVTRFPGVATPAPLLLLSLAFGIIACGNTLFGVLAWPAARGLGEMGYSIYLLHGLVLFTIFGLILGPDRAAALSLTGHWMVVYSCVPLVAVLSFATFRLIEAPAMASVDRVTALVSRAGATSVCSS